MQYFVNFSLPGTEQRLHLLLPWSSLNFNFNDMDTCLKLIVGDELYPQTRNLKLTEGSPELAGINYHDWSRTQNPAACDA